MEPGLFQSWSLRHAGSGAEAIDTGEQLWGGSSEVICQV